MNIRSQLLYEHSKINAELIEKHIGSDQQKFDQLFELFIKNEEVVSQRAAYSMDHCLNHNPNFIFPHLHQLIENIGLPCQHDAIYRSSFRILQFIDVPEHLQGTLFDLSLKFITNEKQAIAIRAFAMTTAYNIAKPYPELLIELVGFIEDFKNHGSPGLRNRACKLLARAKNL